MPLKLLNSLVVTLTGKRNNDRHRESQVQVPQVEEPAVLETDGFIIDKTQIKEYLKVNTISRPAVCRYRTGIYLSKPPKKRKKHFKRYYKVSKYGDPNKSEDEEKNKLTKKNLNSTSLGERDEHFTGFSQEEELSRITATYNKTLGEHPEDISTWLKYVDFQDTVHQFEKSYRKGSIAKAQRVQAERKISILDKALTHNPGCELLLRERLKVAVAAFPADEIQTELKKLVEKEKDNIILWQGYIEATQCSMSHCNAQAVLQLYTKCLSTLHQLRRGTMSEKYLFEESILRMLYQCGLFLKQAGLFEQLWAVLKMYLELNLSDRERFNIERPFNEKELLELEEVVLNSQLPHHEVWLRVEKLRESCHWLPFAGEHDCEDPQRIVFNEDVAELIHPITTPENIFKLVATVLSMLKVPLLPCRHSTMQDLGLDFVPWSLDSVEALLPVFLKLYPVDTLNENLLRDTGRLAVAPQYLKTLPGQEEYLNFIFGVMEGCAECLTGQDQVAMRVWWFRFQRLLIVLDSQGRFKMPGYLKKKIKSGVKDLLKRDDCRNNEVFYVEYALIEQSLGNKEQCFKVLNIALNMNKNKVIVTDRWSEAQTNQCYLYRVLVECSMDYSGDSVLGLLVKLALQRDFPSITNGLIMEAETRFKTVTRELLNADQEHLTTLQHFLPYFWLDWIICHGWFVYWTKGALTCGTFMESILDELEDKPQPLTFQKEVLNEFYCTILFKYCVDNPGCGVFKVLDQVLFQAVNKFPNNLHLLAILAKQQSLTKNMGISGWKVENLLLKTGRAIPTVFAVLIQDLVRFEIEDQAVDSITGMYMTSDWLI